MMFRSGFWSCFSRLEALSAKVAAFIEKTARGETAQSS